MHLGAIAVGVARHAVEAVPTPAAAAGAVGQTGASAVSVIGDVGDVGCNCVAVGDRGQLVGSVVGIRRTPGGGQRAAVPARVLLAEQVAVGVVNICGHVVQGVGNRGDMGQAVVGIGLNRVALAILLVEHGAVWVVIGNQSRLRRVGSFDLGQLVVGVVDVGRQVAVGVGDPVQVLVRVVVPGRGVGVGVGKACPLAKGVIGVRGGGV